MILLEIPKVKLEQELRAFPTDAQVGPFMKAYGKGVRDTLEWLLHGGKPPQESGPFPRSSV